jgi:hypothetical protein
MRSAALRAGLAVAVASFAAASLADEAGLEELAAARARWQSAQSGDYVFAYRKYCDCNRDEPPETVVTVAAGRIVSVMHRHEDTGTEVPAREGSLDLYWTVEGLFDKLARALAGEAVVRVAYEPARGYPTSFFIDYDAALTGDETDLRQFRVEVR